ncbi:MAG: hypothetical protein CMA07_07465 [Euryarchaeota archaeon]|jgi:hypothetical protein|nr:hypothetical protein [Euryarchaeota archaeon]
MRIVNRGFGKVFRKVVNIADRVDIWFRNTFNRSPKQKALEMSQDAIPMRKLDKTIGKKLGIME